MMFRTWSLACTMLAFVVGCAPKPDAGVKIVDGTKGKESPVVQPGPDARKPSPSASDPGQKPTQGQPSKTSAGAPAVGQVDAKSEEAAKNLEDMGFRAFPGATAQVGSFRTDSSNGTTVGSKWTTPETIDDVVKYFSSVLKLTAKSSVKRPESDTHTLVGKTKSGNKATLTIVRATGAKETEIQVTVTGSPSK